MDRRERLEGGQRIQFFSDLGVVATYHPDDPEEYRTLPIVLAIKHARALATRAARPTGIERDDETIERASQKAKDALGAIDVVLGNQQKIAKLADNTCSTTSDLRRTLLSALAEIDAAVVATT